MRIAVVAHLRYPIAPPFMGGMEAHAHLLTQALVARGHDVTLFASGDSDPALPLHPIVERHHEASLPWALWRDTERLTQVQDIAFDRALRAIERDSFDIVHNNTMHPTPHHWAMRTGHPMVTSLHIPPFGGLADAVADTAAPWLRQTATSAAHLATWWDRAPATASIVHNGIDLARWPYRASGNGRAVWCGRITPNKGTAIAIDAAIAAGLDIDLVGPIDCMDYFEAAVAPRLDARTCYHGPLPHDALADVMGGASVLLSTPDWDEPFGLVNAEAMACGVPVAALDRGAMREVVGDAGAIAADAGDLPTAIARALAVPRARCRARAEAMFSAGAMIDGYEAAYAAACAARSSSSATTVAALA